MADTRPFHPRVLLIAEACNPEWVSIPLEGWSHSRAIGQRVDAHLVTQVRNRQALVNAGLVEGRDFTAIDTEDLMGPIYRFTSELRGGAGKGWTLMTAGSSIGYYLFEHRVCERFGRQLARGEFDLVHRLTPMSPTTPSWSMSRMCRRLDVPFVVGPLNGGLPWPPGFDEVRRAENEWLSYIRDLYRYLPGIRGMREAVAAIMVGSRATRDQIDHRYTRKLIYVPENAIEPDRFTARRTRRVATPVRAVFLGRLVPYKGADMLLRALAPFLKDGQMTLTIIGDGPMGPQLKTMAAELGIADAVDFAGWIEHANVQHRLAEHDLFVFPSIREFGGAVALEAMAVGLVPVVVDYGGPGELVTPRVGRTIPIGTREQIVANLQKTVGELLTDPDEIERLSAAAVRRCRSLFTWQAKADQVVEVYRWVLGDRAEKPEYPIPLADTWAED